MNEFKTAQQNLNKKKQEKGGRCVFCKEALDLPPKKLADLYDAMTDDSIEAPTILTVLNSWNINTSLTTINNHRAGRKGLAQHMLRLKEAAKR